MHNIAQIGFVHRINLNSRENLVYFKKQKIWKKEKVALFCPNLHGAFCFANST